MLINMFYPVIHQNKECSRLGVATDFFLHAISDQTVLSAWSPVGRELTEAASELSETARDGSQGWGRRLCPYTCYAAAIPKPVHPAVSHPREPGHKEPQHTFFTCTYFKLSISWRMDLSELRSFGPKSGSTVKSMVLPNNSVQSNLANTECLIFACDAYFLESGNRSK